jgi:chitinase
MLRKFSWLMMCLMGAPVAAIAAPTPVPAPQKPVVVAYYISWAVYDRNWFPKQIEADKITHINYAFANLNEKGEVITGDGLADGRAFGQLFQLRQKNKDLKILISVGGWTWSKYFSNAALTPESRQAFADSAYEYIYKNGFDGIDLDWEYPTAKGNAGNIERPEDPKNFILLLETLRKKLDDEGKRDGKYYPITVAVGAAPRHIDGLEYKKVGELLDFINIMAYDYHGSWNPLSGNNAPLFKDPADPSEEKAWGYGSWAVDAIIKAGVPAKKLILGVPFYGRSWKGCPKTGNGQYQKCTGGAGPGTWEAGFADFHDIEANYVNKKGFTRYWNDKAKVPYLYNPDGGVFISYDDVESMKHKLDFVKQKGLGGVMYWEVTADKQKTLVNLIAESVLGVK